MSDNAVNTKVILAEQVSDVENWSLPEVAPGDHDASTCPGPLTARQLEELYQQARNDGFTAGRKEGLDAGRKESAARAMQLDAILQTLATPLEELDDAVEQQLVTLIITSTRHLVRRELRTDPGEILAVVREALGVLPVAARNVRLHLHPDDAELVRATLPVSGNEQTWAIAEDPMLTRGGCRVSSDTSQIDATVESRLNAVIASIFGAGRQSDLAPEAE